ncbi:50S ribosomal protein L20 [bacterium]|nr:50S ribosomal protein L20 [bacterium]
MPRATQSVPSHQRRRKLLNQAKGYRGAKHRLFKTAKEAVQKGWLYAYRDRRQKKREFRRLWITRINAAARLCDVSYSRFIAGLKKNEIELNRKILAELAISDSNTFQQIVKKAVN